MRHAAIAYLIILLAVALSGAPAAADEAEYEEAYSAVKTLPADGKVYLTNVSGDVHIKTWTRNEVKIEAMKRSIAGSAEQAKKNADLVEIQVRREDGRLKIETEYPEGPIVLRKFKVSIDYTLTVPVGADATVATVSGDVVARDMAGFAELTTVSGDVRADNMKKGGEFRSVSGDIALNDIVGDVQAADVSGDIAVSGISGSLEVECVSGSIIARNLSGAESVNISVHSGEIEFDGDVDPDGRYSFKTHSGSVTVTLPADAEFDFECETFSGDIDSDFRALYYEEDSDRHREHEIHGTVNGGGADVTIKTFSGSIQLRKAGRSERESSRARSRHSDTEDD
ncbi:MAG: DUF4097 family beta strand repeat protein [Candidatus Eisenbacteria bacterium]|nr:DUF4097 family beta strand repeat protein [Candidatus Eisenbacteria bacterium]